MRSIGRIIAENRKKKGLSQPKLAELLSQQGIDVYSEGNLQMGDRCTRTRTACFSNSL